MADGLAGLNNQVVKIVQSLNEKIDYEDRCSSDELRLARADTCMRKRETLLKQLQKQVTEAVKKYENFVTACRESPLDMETRMLSIYHRTRRQSEKNLDCVTWTVIPLFREPSITILPQDVSEHSGRSTVSNALFRMKSHYHARSHWSIKGATQHIDALRQKLGKQSTICASLEDAEANRKSRLDAINTRMAEQCLESIQLHHEWRSAYELYAQHMRLFIRLCEHPQDLWKKNIDSPGYQSQYYTNLLAGESSTGSLGLSQTISIREIQNKDL